MNTSKALASVDEYISSVNDSLDKEPKNKNLKKEIVASIDFISEILGVGTKDSFEYFQFGISTGEKEKIEELISKRAEAKKDKNFELSDNIRDEISSMGISLMDSANGTLWEKNNL